MSKLPSRLADERGFFTLPVPKPKVLNWLSNFRLYRLIVHRLLYLRLRFPHGGRTMLLLGTAALGITTFALLANFFIPKTLALSFGQENCFFNPQLMPQLTNHEPSPTFAATSRPLLDIAGFPLVSFQTCVHASAAPLAESLDTLSLAPFGNPIFKKKIVVKTGLLPAPSAAFDVAEPVGTGSNLSFTLDQPDNIFTYSLASNEAQAVCSSRLTSLSCPLKELGLRPGASYELTLNRQFKNQHRGAVLTTGVTTLDPVVVISSTIAEGATVYDAPRTITLTFNKPLKTDKGSARLTKTSDNSPGPELVTKIEGTNLTLSFEELTRQTAYRLDLDGLEAEDGSQLEAPYALNFHMSGGPKVISVSIGSYKVPLNSTVTINFDVGLNPAQNFAHFAWIETAAGAVAAKISLSGNSLSVNPHADLPRCTPFTVKLNGGLVNQYNIGGGEAWEYKSRTICQSVFSIGKSVQGRSITAYRFGTGASKIVFVGGMHGNEKSSVATLNGWIDYLEQNAEKLPTHRSVIVIPNHNPDGYASSRRTNANNVDLNRNFPSNDWATAVQMPGNQFLPNGGGISPLDQPESSALASFIQSENPRLVLTYHAVAKVVISNDSGDSVALAQKYASDSGYPFTSNADSHGTFEYATTGEFEDWLADQENVPGILVELSSMSANQFSTHRQAMWNLAQLP